MQWYSNKEFLFAEADQHRGYADAIQADVRVLERVLRLRFGKPTEGLRATLGSLAVILDA